MLQQRFALKFELLESFKIFTVWQRICVNKKLNVTIKLAKCFLGEVKKSAKGCLQKTQNWLFGLMKTRRDQTSIFERA